MKKNDKLKNVNEPLTPQLNIGTVISNPNELEPVLALITHQGELGLSEWYEVVYYFNKWCSYAGSKTFQDGEKVVNWKYCKDCL
jgi:hypothetical protein